MMEIHIHENTGGNVYWVQKGGGAGLGETEVLKER
jgi:hypothetical protein